MNTSINDILIEWAYRVNDGKPNPKSIRDRIVLESVLKDFGWNVVQRNALIENLTEAPDNKPLSKQDKDKIKKMGLIWKGKGYGKENEEGILFKNVDGKLVSVDKKGDEKKDDAGKLDTKGEFERGSDSNQNASPNYQRDVGKSDDSGSETQSHKNTSENINKIDGQIKADGLNKKEKAPGNDTSTMNEVGVGYAMACLDESPDDVDGCLNEKMKDTVIGKKMKKDQSEEIIQSAKAEKARVDRHLQKNNMNPESTSVTHVWGAKSSLQAAADQLEELKKKGVETVNGISIDKYKEIILGGGGGDDPTDTIIVMIDESQDPPKVEILHTSNKTTSDDIQGNGSPNEELNQISDKAKDKLENEENKKAVDEANEKQKKEIEDARVEQKNYVDKQSEKMSNHFEDDDVCDKAIAMLENGPDDTPPGISTAAGKYWKEVLKRKAVRDYIKEQGWSAPYDDNQKRTLMRIYAQDLAKEDTELRDTDVQIIARMYGDRKIPKKENGELVLKGGKKQYDNVSGEEYLTGKPAEEPKFSNEELDSYYARQTEAINSHREELNEIGKKEGKDGLGDKEHTNRMIHRLHLGVADGEPAGEVPADNFQLNMGRYKRKDIQQDRDGRYLTNKGGKWYEITKDGVSDTPIDPQPEKSDLTGTSECAVIADGETHRHCLGMKEGEKVEDGFSVDYGEIQKDGKSYKAIIYDRNKKIVGYQICRSKSGPGGSVNDTIQYHKDYQKCMAEHTISSGRCG